MKRFLQGFDAHFQFQGPVDLALSVRILCCAASLSSAL
jgi:hypothetical protein